MNMENGEPGRCSNGINLLRDENSIDNNSVGLTFRSQEVPQFVGDPSASRLTIEAFTGSLQV
jgi:hypothetical protein